MKVFLCGVIMVLFLVLCGCGGGDDLLLDDLLDVRNFLSDMLSVGNVGFGLNDCVNLVDELMVGGLEGESDVVVFVFDDLIVVDGDLFFVGLGVVRDVDDLMNDLSVIDFLEVFVKSFGNL